MLTFPLKKQRNWICGSADNSVHSLETHQSNRLVLGMGSASDMDYRGGCCADFISIGNLNIFRGEEK